MGALRKYFVSGIVVLLPLGLTVFVIWFLVSRLGSILQPLLAKYTWLSRLPAWLTTFIGFIVVVLLIVAAGALASGILGRWFVSSLDRLIGHVPFIKGVYGSARLLTEAVLVKRSSLRKVVIAEYPSRGLLAIGFLTSEQRIELADGRRAAFVYFPTTPSPTTGWLAIVPEESITETDITTDEGLKLVISGGIVSPADLSQLVKWCRMASPGVASRLSAD